MTYAVNEFEVKELLVRYPILSVQTMEDNAASATEPVEKWDCQEWARIGRQKQCLKRSNLLVAMLKTLENPHVLLNTVVGLVASRGSRKSFLDLSYTRPYSPGSIQPTCFSRS